MLTRILVIVILVAIALWMLRKALGHPRKGSGNTTRANSTDRTDNANSANNAARPRDLVACSHCGLHLPRDEALWHNAKAYCSSQHAKDGPADTTGDDGPM